MGRLIAHVVLTLLEGRVFNPMLVVGFTVSRCFFNCNTKFIIYLITCKESGIQYVGCTTRLLRDRLHDHIYDTEKEHTTNVAKHFNEAHNRDKSLIQIQAIEKILTPRREGDRFGVLCKCEVFWIFILQTRILNGLNFEWDLTHFYS